MALKSFRRLITNTLFSPAVITTVAPPIQTNDKGYPAGEEFWQGLALRIYGMLNIVSSGAGTAKDHGPARFLRNVYVETDKHGPIVNNVDGLSLARLHEFLNGTPPAVTLPSPLTTGTPSFSETIHIPFALPGVIRPEDSHLLMKTARGKVTRQGGVFTDLVTGGTNSTAEITAAFCQETAMVKAHENGSPLASMDMPVYIPFIELKKIDITGTEASKKIELPYGDRIYQFIAISQRNSSTLDEIDNAIITRTANIRLEKNNLPRVNTIQWADVQDETKRIFKMATLPAGWGVIHSCGDLNKPAQISEMLDTVDTSAGTLNLFADVVTGSNYALWVLMFGYMPLKSRAAFADLPADVQAALVK
jgi:hypothetical protein